jgi:hypothetical protein
MPSPCPWCCEPLSRRERGESRCAHCGRPLRTDQGKELRPVDLRYEGVEAAQCGRYSTLVLYGSAVAAALVLPLPLLHAAAPLAVPLLVVAHMLVLRLHLIRRAVVLLGSKRRFFVRWITRLSLLWLGMLGYGLSLAPVVGVIPAVATWAGLTTLVHRYTLWSLGRERRRLPLMLWEKIAFTLFAVLTVGGVLLLAALALLLGWSVAALIELFSR